MRPIYSRHHLVVSIVVGTLTALVVDLPAAPVVGVVAVLGVGIDLDHFPIARWNRGDWSPVRRCLRRPSLVVVDQASIFESGDIRALQRHLTHVLVGGALVGGTLIGAPEWAPVVGVAVYSHVLTDLCWDVYRRERAGWEQFGRR